MNLQALEIFQQSEHYRKQRNWLNHEMRIPVCLKMSTLPDTEAQSLFDLYLSLIDQTSRLRQHSHWAQSRIFNNPPGAETFIKEFKVTVDSYTKGLELFCAIMGVSC